MEELLRPEIQEAMFKKAFDYIKERHGIVNLQSCISEMYNKQLDEEYVICVCLACISLIEKGSEDFEKIQEGLTQKMKKSIMMQVGEHLKKN
jgi:hypothetical protein